MPITNEHPPGAPCWFELGTTDQDAAKEFYNRLFGWSLNDFPMGPNEVYTIFQREGRDVASCYKLPEQMTQQGIPPNWGVYFSTKNADDSAAKVAQLGGTVIQGPFDVMENGRMAICQDPGGAIFSLWEPKKTQGVGVFNEDNAVCWVELASWDVPKAREFYSALFGWETKQSANMPTYIEYSAGGRPTGGLLPMDEHWGKIPSHWAIYFRVADCDGAVAKAKELGGSTRMDPFEVPGVGRIAAIVDPRGAAFYMIHLKT